MVKAVTLQIESQILTYDPTQRLEFPDTQAIRRFGRLNEKILYPFLESYYQSEQRIRQMQGWGLSPEAIQKALTPTLLEPEQNPTEPISPSAIQLLKDAFIATIKGQIF